MLIPNRFDSIEDYRYGFNSKENDDEIKGVGNHQDYGMRMYDPRIGRFFSVDPVFKDYPFLTPYQFSSNTPIQAIDLDGAEAWVVVETDGVGHTFIVIPSEKNPKEYVLYSYGRYLGSTTPSSGGYGPVGYGVLIRKDGADAKEYLKKRLSLGSGKTTFVFELPKADAELIRDAFDEKFNKGSVVPKNSKAYDEYGETAKVIDEYRLIPIGKKLASNCTTKTCEAIEIGNSLDEFSPKGDAYRDLNMQIDPKALGAYLKIFEAIDQEKNVKNKNVIDVTDKAKKAFEIFKIPKGKTVPKGDRFVEPSRPVGPLRPDGTF